jgi:hypothetical protein
MLHYLANLLKEFFLPADNNNSSKFQSRLNRVQDILAGSCCRFKFGHK